MHVVPFPRVVRMNVAISNNPNPLESQWQRCLSVQKRDVGIVPKFWLSMQTPMLSTFTTNSMPAILFHVLRNIAALAESMNTTVIGCWRERVVQYCRVDSIGKRALTNRSIRRMVNLYWRSVKWSCRSENCISLEGLRKYFTSSGGIDPVSVAFNDQLFMMFFGT